MNRTLFALVFTLLWSAVWSQNTDSLNFVNAKWNKTKANGKVKLYTCHFDSKNLFGANQYISYVIVKKNKRKWGIAADPQKLITTSRFAKEHNAIAAVNGNFFNMKNGGSVDFTKVNGDVINTNSLGKNRARDFHQKAAVVVNKGSLSIQKWDGSANWEKEIDASDIMLNGPLLVHDGNTEKLDSGLFNTARHPRTSVGVTRKGQIIMLVVDGRRDQSAGMSLFELTKVMRWLGCVDAINFDGGGSSTLWVRDKGVVNYPADNRKWDHEGERKVANILYLKKR